MSSFQYRIQTVQGRLSTGRVEAVNEAEAIAKVRKLGGTMLNVSPIRSSGGQGMKKGLGRAKLPLKERIIFTEQLAVMLRAGVTLTQALKGLQEESTNRSLTTILGSVIAQVEGGTPFSSALAQHPSTFSSIYVQMIHSAEKTGNLAEILLKLTQQQQKEYELKGKVRGALIYPAIVSTLLIVVIIIVITFILPKLTVMFTESKVSLPLSTRFLIALSNFMVHDWYLLIIGVAALLLVFRAIVHNTHGRLWWDRVKLKIPVLGPFTHKAYMARFCQSFASLAQAGVPVLEIFETLKGVVGNSLYEVEIAKISREVSNGVKVSTAIRKSRHFPPMIGQLVSVGEQSGDLAGIFVVLGDFFEKEVDGMAKNLSTILEPVIMIVMGVVIGFVLISVIQPIYGLVNTT